MGIKFAKSVRKAKTSWDLFGHRCNVKVAIAVVAVGVDSFGLCGVSGPSEVRARLKEGEKLPQLQLRTILAASNCLVQNWENSFSPPFCPSLGRIFRCCFTELSVLWFVV